MSAPAAAGAEQPGSHPAPPSRRELNRRAKRWPGWLLMAVIVAGLMAFGAARDRGVQSQSDRVDEITKRVACPVCDGESVFESRNNSSRAIRNRVAELVRENELDDQQIISTIEASFGGQVLLVPRATGIDSLIWVLPAVGFVLGVAGLAAAFSRWRDESRRLGAPTDDDVARVEAAMLAGDLARDSRIGDAEGRDPT